ncbi:putative immunity protein [Saccharomonospora sp. CUA-673]|uniref:putative immunity protein n=1 Tax=Saccharomonospora sp. CUA-673 TaxID=1904969 RepID=UPI0035170747
MELGLDEIRAVAAFAADCARPALPIFERACPGDDRPRRAIDVTEQFADGGPRTKEIRDVAWEAWRAYQEARDAGMAAAAEHVRASRARSDSGEAGGRRRPPPIPGRTGRWLAAWRTDPPPRHGPAQPAPLTPPERRSRRGTYADCQHDDASC